MAEVVSYNGEHVRVVKNLGWLLRHASDVHTIMLTSSVAGGCFLTAFLDDGRRFQTYFHSVNVCRDWIKRPSLQGVRIADCID